MWNDVEQAVANVQSHKTADGIGASRRPFANDNVREQFAITARTICAAVTQSVDLKPAQIAALVQATANHRSRAHQQTVYAYKELAKRASTIADALAERPEALGLGLALKTILVDHAHRSKLAAQALAERQADFVAPKPIAYARDPAFALVELTTPSHLQAESAVLKHCVGTTHNVEALRAKRHTSPPPHGPIPTV